MVVLRDASDIERLIGTSWTRLVVPNVSVSLPSLPEDTTRTAESTLNGDANACGCGVAGVAASVALLAYAAFLFGTQGAPPGWAAAELAIGGGVVLVAGVTGKIAGIAVARRRWLTTLHDLAAASARGGAG